MNLKVKPKQETGETGSSTLLAEQPSSLGNKQTKEAPTPNIK